MKEMNNVQGGNNWCSFLITFKRSFQNKKKYAIETNSM